MKVCSVDGCTKPHRARGLCSTHYNQRHQPNRHTPRKVACAVCGTEVERWGGGGKGGPRRPVCSERCRSFLSHGRFPPGKDLVGPMAQPVRPARPLPPPAPSAIRRWVSGPCANCGSSFTAQLWDGGNAPRYCSRACGRRASDRRHSSSRGWCYNSWIAPDRRYAIYARDNWICQLCGEPVDSGLPYNDDWAASLDHVVPRSKGGAHEDANLRLAHRWCNAVRQDDEPRSLEHAA